jgi:hypothetical protein
MEALLRLLQVVDLELEQLALRLPLELVPFLQQHLLQVMLAQLVLSK